MARTRNSSSSQISTNFKEKQRYQRDLEKKNLLRTYPNNFINGHTQYPYSTISKSNRERSDVAKLIIWKLAFSFDPCLYQLVNPRNAGRRSMDTKLGSPAELSERKRETDLFWFFLGFAFAFIWKLALPVIGIHQNYIYGQD